MWALRTRLGWDAVACARGLQATRLRGRLQSCGGQPELIVDVAHNPQAASELALWLDAQPRVPTHAVFSALADKDIAGIGAALGARIAHWHVCAISDAGARGLDAASVAARLRVALPQAAISLHVHAHAALAAARAALPASGRVLAFGSFTLPAQCWTGCRRRSERCDSGSEGTPRRRYNPPPFQSARAPVDARLKQRLIGAAVLLALIVIVVPMFFVGSRAGRQRHDLGQPWLVPGARPEPPLQSKTL
ncbi:hypothetical protein B2A_13338, partial [mine drainage metagenome]